jgi:hypothetical protein
MHAVIYVVTAMPAVMLALAQRGAHKVSTQQSLRDNWQMLVRGLHHRIADAGVRIAPQNRSLCEAEERKGSG